MTRNLYVVPDDAVTQIIPTIDDATVWVSPGPRDLTARTKLLAILGFALAAWVIALGILAVGWLAATWVVS